MARPKIVALIGIDGAGKSTQAALLAEWLTASGSRAVFCKNPGGRLRMDRMARRLGRADAADLIGRRTLSVIEVAVRWLSVARAHVRSRLSRRVAVMDRHLYCQYAVIRMRGGRGERLARVLYSVFPRPDLVCFLVVTPAVAQRRIAERGYDTEELSDLTALDQAYRSLPEAQCFVTLDADGSVASVQAAVRGAVTDRRLHPSGAAPPA